MHQCSWDASLAVPNQMFVSDCLRLLWLISVVGHCFRKVLIESGAWVSLCSFECQRSAAACAGSENSKWAISTIVDLSLRREIIAKINYSVLEKLEMVLYPHNSWKWVHNAVSSLSVRKINIAKKNSSLWKTLQNSSCKIPICLQISVARVSQVWQLQPWHRKKKKPVQTTCLMRKSSLNHRRRLQFPVNIHRQNEAISGTLCPRSCSTFRNCLLFLWRTIN